MINNPLIIGSNTLIIQNGEFEVTTNSTFNEDIQVQNGGITGSYADTFTSNNVYEGIREAKTGPMSKLQHKWTIPVDSGYDSYVFFIETYHTTNVENDDNSLGSINTFKEKPLKLINGKQNQLEGYLHDKKAEFVKDGGGYCGYCGGTALFTELSKKPTTFLERQYDKSAIGVSCVKSYYKDIAFPIFYPFQRLYPDLEVVVQEVEEPSISGLSDRSRNSGLITDKLPDNYDKTLWKLVIGRDIVVPIFNAKNPFVNEIYRQGISLEGFKKVFKDPELRVWGTLMNNMESTPVNFYMVDDESIIQGLAELSGLDQLIFDGIKVTNGEELIASIRNDPNAIGFCKITDMPDPGNQDISESVKLLPLDRNNDGRIAYMEEIYKDVSTLSRGVWAGKYPEYSSQ